MTPCPLCVVETPRMDPSRFYEEVGRQIRDLRAARGMSQGDLASALSLTRTSVTNIERGRQRILVHTLYELSEILGVDPIELFPMRDSLSVSEAADLLPRDLPDRERQWIAGVAASAERS